MVHTPYSFLALQVLDMINKTGAELSTKAMALLNEQGYAANIISSSEKGTPDILACVNGRFVAIEIKGRGDTLKLDQSRKLKAVYGAGGVATVAKTLADVQMAIDLANSGKQGPPPPDLDIKSFTI